jgi:anti-anti-sigma factor
MARYPLEYPLQPERQPSGPLPSSAGRKPVPRVITVEHAEGVARIAVVGEIGLIGHDDLRGAIMAALLRPVTEILVDLADTKFLDVEGVGVLVDGHRMATQVAVGFRVVNPRNGVRRLLEISDVLDVLTESPVAPRDSRPAPPRDLGI